MLLAEGDIFEDFWPSHSDQIAPGNLSLAGLLFPCLNDHIVIPRPDP